MGRSRKIKSFNSQLTTKTKVLKIFIEKKYIGIKCLIYCNRNSAVHQQKIYPDKQKVFVYETNEENKILKNAINIIECE